MYNSNICKILLYNRQLVFITYELIYVARAAHRQWGNRCGNRIIAICTRRSKLTENVYMLQINKITDSDGSKKKSTVHFQNGLIASGSFMFILKCPVFAIAWQCEKILLVIALIKTLINVLNADI